jgi:hypothetical protein
MHESAVLGIVHRRRALCVAPGGGVNESASEESCLLRLEHLQVRGSGVIFVVEG